MSLSGALHAGISALHSTSSALGVIADNISNMESLSYKRREAMFSSFVVNAYDKKVEMLVKSHIRPYMNVAGRVERSGVDTHMAIFGQGFFLVKQGADQKQTTFSRLGTFELDHKGYLVNHLGFYLQGINIRGKNENEVMALDQDLSKVESVKVQNLISAPKATSNLDFSAVLNSDETVKDGYSAGEMQSGTKAADFKTSVEVYDSKGGRRRINIGFIKTGKDKWSVEIYPHKSSQLASGGKTIATGDIVFNSDGVPSISSALKNVRINWASSLGINTQDIKLNFQSMFHLASPSRLEGRVQYDGNSLGRLDYFKIREDGVIEAFFNNGKRESIYKLPVATFANPNKLLLRQDGTYSPSTSSGVPNLFSAGDSGTGKILGSSLEKSNVDVADEFSKIIIIRRNASAATKVVSVADRMMEELVQIIRA